MIRKRILLHICCGPCALIPVLRLREQGFRVAGLFYNPNIHGLNEYVRRREALDAVVSRLGLDVVCLDLEYNPSVFFQAVTGREDERCGRCYELRLKRTFVWAQDNGFAAVSTTLLFSRFQKHEAILAQGQILQAETGIRFFGQDFRIDWQEGIDLSRQWELYRQNYCGCLYSEVERRKKILQRLAASSIRRERNPVA